MRRDDYVKVEEGVFNSSCLVDFMHCPRLFYYKWIRRLELKEEKPSLTFGKVFHEALLVWYQTGDRDEALKVFEKLPASIQDDYRTKEWGQAIFKEYVERYKSEPYRTLYLEKEFAVEIGERVLVGTVDKIVDWNGQIYVVDHKTSSSVGLSFFNKFRPNVQIDGYCYACRELLGSCSGAIINGISVAKAPKERFARDISSRSKEELERYAEVFSYWTGEIERCLREGKWVMNTTSCNRFGRCVFWELCVYGEDERLVEWKFKQGEKEVSND